MCVCLAWIQAYYADIVRIRMPAARQSRCAQQLAYFMPGVRVACLLRRDTFLFYAPAACILCTRMFMPHMYVPSLQTRHTHAQNEHMLCVRGVHCVVHARHLRCAPAHAVARRDSAGGWLSQ